MPRTNDDDKDLRLAQSTPRPSLKRKIKGKAAAKKLKKRNIGKRIADSAPASGTSGPITSGPITPDSLPAGWEFTYKTRQSGASSQQVDPFLKN